MLLAPTVTECFASLGSTTPSTRKLIPSLSSTSPVRLPHRKPSDSPKARYLPCSRSAFPHCSLQAERTRIPSRIGRGLWRNCPAVKMRSTSSKHLPFAGPTSPMRYYAQCTVDMASARLALLAGDSIYDVITSLEARHAATLPAALCSARAREIAQTAAHMIARRKLA